MQIHTFKSINCNACLSIAFRRKITNKIKLSHTYEVRRIDCYSFIQKEEEKKRFTSCQVSSFVIYYILTNSIRYTINSVHFMYSMYFPFNFSFYSVSPLQFVHLTVSSIGNKGIIWFISQPCIATISLELITRLWIQFENNFK